jgi:predicted PurR-regulated permease PerM
MPDRFNKFIRSTSENIKHFRDTLQQMKDERRENQKIERVSIKETHETKQEEQIIHFSLVSTAKATIVVLGLIALSHFLGEIGKVLLVFFISILFSAALTPMINWLAERKIPKVLGVLLIYFLLILILGFFVSQLIPLVATQLVELAKSLTELVNRISSGEINVPFGEQLKPVIGDFMDRINQETIVDELKQSLEGLAAQLQSLAGDTFGVIKTIFNGVFNFIMVLILTFFLIIDGRSVNDFFVSLFPSRHGAYIMGKIETIQMKVGYWLQGQVVLMVLMFILYWIGFTILGVESGLTLAMMGGIAELLPVVGPIAAGIPALLVGFNESPWMALWVFMLLILIQQLEGHILVPLVMRKAVGLSPIIIILAMLIGFETIGIVGMIMAIPVATCASIFVMEYAAKKK